MNKAVGHAGWCVKWDKQLKLHRRARRNRIKSLRRRLSSVSPRRLSYPDSEHRSIGKQNKTSGLLTEETLRQQQQQQQQQSLKIWIQWANLEKLQGPSKIKNQSKWCQWKANYSGLTEPTMEVWVPEKNPLRLFMEREMWQEWGKNNNNRATILMGWAINSKDCKEKLCRP